LDIPRERTSRHRRYIPAAIVAGIVVVLTALVWRLEPASPTVDRATIWTDSVRLGEMVRQVRGPGTLVPEQARWIVAVTSGRVERIHVEPGAAVGPQTVLLELSNPDVQVEGLNAERQLAAVEAELANLQVTLHGQRLEQRSRVAQVAAEQRETQRRVEASRELAERQLIPRMELQRLEDQAAELSTRLEIERERLDLLDRTLDDRIDGQRRQIERLRAIADFQRGRSESMQVRASASGVVQDLRLEIGQWVMPGQSLARVVEPGRLMAVLRVPETQARDLSVGQSVSVDTRNGIIAGHVRRIDPSVQQGAVTVEVGLDEELPRGARPDLSIEGTVQIERLEQVLHTGRPAYGQANSLVSMWKLVDGGKAAIRVPVRLGRSSVNTIEIVDGLQPGDVVILSDLSAHDSHDRIRLR
jgi:HlyD family secretion protein